MGEAGEETGSKRKQERASADGGWRMDMIGARPRSGRSRFDCIALHHAASLPGFQGNTKPSAYLHYLISGRRLQTVAIDPYPRKVRPGTEAVPGYNSIMSFKEVLAQWPEMSVSERQTWIRRARELDDPGLSREDEAVVEERLAAHRREPGSAVSIEEMEARVRGRSRV